MTSCKQCHGPLGDAARGPFCSYRCRGRAARGVDETRVWSCVDCGAEMTPRTSRSDATRCPRCSKVKPALSARQLADRDGIACGVCGEDVDMSRDGSRDPSGPAADHVIPRAKGGPNTPDNLQLAHFRCNAVKRAEDVTPAWAAALAAEARTRAAEAAVAPLADTCGAGHPRTPENGSWTRNGWRCQPCRSARQRDRRAAETDDARTARNAREVAARTPEQRAARAERERARRARLREEARA